MVAVRFEQKASIHLTSFFGIPRAFSLCSILSLNTPLPVPEEEQRLLCQPPLSRPKMIGGQEPVRLDGVRDAVRYYCFQDLAQRR
uniref:WGS project CBMG000000000 data, contig CS5907-c000975 n=1 Tax=Fusarium acuminatum CS5907 TaxID=1318461 RepID=A0A096PEF8_9HYPO|nr:unnamed protein product [Fusarium acuminatum CS5907]